MMNEIKSLGYNVYFDGSLAALNTFLEKNSYDKVVVLVDSNTLEHCLPVFQFAVPHLTNFDVIEVDPGEENKNIDFCIGVWQNMLDFEVDRHSLIINLGGGVVTDMGGFAASTFKRGVDFIQIPTTLLSQVDASVGGKTGIDMGNVKNIVGTFAQPKGVFINTDFLITLDSRQVASGFAEIIKHGLIYDERFYQQIKKISPSEITSQDIYQSVKIKNEVVTEDPQEQDLRKILNFGHTVGHALEGYSLENDPNPLLHGEAIAAGMICESYLSHIHNGLPLEDLNDIVATFHQYYAPYQFGQDIYDVLLSLMKNDKKNQSGEIGFALLSKIGSCDYNIFLPESAIVESLDFYLQTIK